MPRFTLLLLFFFTLFVFSFEARLGKNSTPLSTNAEITPQKYAQGLEFWGLLSDSTGEITFRQSSVYLARDDEGLSVAVVSECHRRIPVDARDDVQILVNANGASPVFAKVNGLGELDAPNGVSGVVKSVAGKWCTELKIPWKLLKKEDAPLPSTLHLQVRRHWHDPEETALLDTKDLLLTLDDDAPGLTARLGNARPIDGGAPLFQWEVTAPASSGVSVRCEARVQWLGNPEGLDERQEVQPGQTRTFQLKMSGADNDRRQFSFALTTPQGKVLAKRDFAYGGKEGLVWNDPVPEIGFSLSTYPSRKWAKARVHSSSEKRLDELAEVHFAISDTEEKHVFTEVEAPRTPFGFHKEWSLDGLPDGSYLMLAKITDNTGKLTVWKQPFEYRHYAWEDNQIGKERVVIPPFRPLQVDEAEGTVQATLTGYRLGEGLFSAVFAEGENILTAPVQLVLNGATLSAQGLSWHEEAPDRVTASQTLAAPDLEVKVHYDVDYDGFVLTRLEFHPKGSATMNSLTLDLPLKSEVATLLHSVCAQLRRNPALELPAAEQEGLVWDSLHNSPANFRPYLWLGSIAKGFAWLCESEKNWSIDRARPVLEVLRQGDTTLLRVHIVSAPCVRREPFVIEMGFQASPVKPQMPNFRRYSTVAVNGFVADNSIPVAQILHSRMWGQQYCGSHNDDGFAPQDNDYSFIEYLSNCQNIKPQEIEEHVNAFVDRHFHSQDVADTYRIFLGHAARSLTRHAQYAIPYVNPRGMSLAWPEAAAYQCEWRNDSFRTGNDGHYFHNPVESYRDYVLPQLRELVRHGFDGLYFDNTFDSVNEDEVQGHVVEYAPFRFRFHYTMLEMRKLVKRTATMLYTEGKCLEDRPFLVLHATNSVPLPVLAFASHQLDWEAYYGQSDYQERFSNGYILSETTGLQSGCVPQVLLDSDTTPDHNQVTALALLLPYALLDIHQSHTGPTQATSDILNLIRNYGYGEPEVKVLPCYAPANPLRLSANVRAALVQREDSALVLAGDFGSDGQFDLDFSALGYQNPVVLDALTGEKLGEKTSLQLAIPHHASRVFLLADGEGAAQSAIRRAKTRKPTVTRQKPARGAKKLPLYKIELTPSNLLDIDPRQNIELFAAEETAMLVPKDDSAWLDLVPSVCRGQNISVQFQYRSDTPGTTLEAHLRYAPGEIYCEGPEGPTISCQTLPDWQTACCKMQFPETLEEPLVQFFAKGGSVQVKSIQVFLGDPPETLEGPKTIEANHTSTTATDNFQAVSAHQELPPSEIQRLITDADKTSDTLVRPPDPTEEELQEVAIPELSQPLEMQASEENFLNVKATLQNGTTLVARFPVEPLQIREAKGEWHAALPVFDEAHQGGLQPDRLISCYGGLLPDTVRIFSATTPQTEYQPRQDFHCYARLSQIGAVVEGAVQGPVLMDYQYQWQRIDSVTLLDNQLHYRKGAEARITPPLPELRPGEIRLGNVYLSPDTKELTDGNLFPIHETRYPVKIQPVADDLLPRTMAKLRKGDPLRILAWGDSITAITYEMPGWKTARWQEQFAAGLRGRFPKCPIQVITEAWGGHNSDDYLDPSRNPGSGKPHNFQERVLDLQPDLIISEFSNDRWMPYSLLYSPQSNYYRLLHEFRARKIEWIILAPPYGGPTVPFEAAAQKHIHQQNEYLSFLRQFAPTNGIPLADVSARFDRLWLQGLPLLALTTYGVHPHRDGLQVFAQALLDLFPQN